MLCHSAKCIVSPDHLPCRIRYGKGKLHLRQQLIFKSLILGREGSHFIQDQWLLFQIDRKRAADINQNPQG